MNYIRKEGETELELLWRVASDKERNNWTWDEVAKIMNELTEKNKTESSWRKRYRSMQKVVNGEEEKHIKKPSDELTELQAIQLERKKIQTEKTEYNKWLRELARDEMIMEQIVDAVNHLKPLKVPENIIKPTHSTKGYLVAFGDEHFGAEYQLKDVYDRVINEYSPEIFEKRMWELLGYIIEIVEEKNIKELNVFSLGDALDGTIRVSQLMKLRYGVVEATIKYADFICTWLNKLSEYVYVKFQMTNGNHTELRMLGQPKGTFTEDNMGEIIAEFIKVRLADNPNFVFLQNPTGNIFAQIATHTVLAIHGEVKNMEKALREYSSIYNVPIGYLIAGHLHHSKKEDVGIDTEVINVPSIIGADPYSLSLRKLSAPGAKLLEFDQLRGITCEYSLRLLN